MSVEGLWKGEERWGSVLGYGAGEERGWGKCGVVLGVVRRGGVWGKVR